MTIYRVYRLSFDYENETTTKEYLKENFTNEVIAKKVCLLHKKIDGGVYCYENIELGKTYDSFEVYKADNKQNLINKKIKYLTNKCYLFPLLKADDFGDFHFVNVELSIKDMENIINKFNSTTKKSIQIHNCFCDLIKVKETDLPNIIAKKQEVDKDLKRLQHKLNNNDLNNIL